MEGAKRNRLIIIGAGGHGKVIADIAVKNGYEDIVFLDDNEEIKECAGFPVVGKTKEAKTLDGDKIVAIGNATIREKMQKEMDTVILIHPDAVIGRRVKIGNGTVVMAGVVINSDTQIGEGCIINTAASVDHDCVVEDYSHIAVGAHLCGIVHVGKGTWIGAGSTISNNVNICSDITIGAGAVVVNDLKEQGTYIGVPAKKMSKCNLTGGVQAHRNNIRNKS